MDALKGWKTIGIFIASALVYLLAWPELTSVIDAKYIAIATTVIGIVLRIITTTAIFTNETPKIP